MRNIFKLTTSNWLQLDRYCLQTVCSTAVCNIPFISTKLHTGFRLMSISMTLNDLDGVTTAAMRCFCGSWAFCILRLQVVYTSYRND